MISKRVLFIAAMLLVASAAGAMAATVNVDNFTVAQLSIDASSALNLQSTGSYGIVTADVLHPTPTPFSTINGYIVNGLAGGAWNGLGGINSSAAASDPNGATTLACVLGDDELNLIGNPTFYGHTVASDDSLIRYTYYGDCELGWRC